MESDTPPRAWLLMVAGDNRGHGGNDGYDDQLDAYYSWDSNVPNHTKLTVGDPVALWDKEQLLGVSVIEEIEAKPGEKVLRRCPNCATTRISDRKTRQPRFRCMRCHEPFPTPDIEVVDVLNYRARYDAAWTSLEGVLDGSVLRSVSVNPREFNAMRRLNWAALREALLHKDATRAVDRVAARIDLQAPPVGRAALEVSQGFSHAFVRVRRGQQQFRDRLLAAQGSVCAFTGEAPPRVLEAGHLYSYATLGTHFEHGGLMLRRDIHRLFDDGLLAVEPSRLRVDVSPELAAYPQYKQLNERPLTLRLRDEQVEWLSQHWDAHRAHV